MEIASTSLFSSNFRMSRYFCTPARLRDRRSSTSRSTSQSATTRAPWIFPNSLMCDSPRPFKPTTATRTRSLAPTTCDQERGVNVQAAAPARDDFKKLRRERAFIAWHVLTTEAGAWRARFCLHSDHQPSRTNLCRTCDTKLSAHPKLLIVLLPPLRYQ